MQGNVVVDGDHVSGGPWEWRAMGMEERNQLNNRHNIRLDNALRYMVIGPTAITHNYLHA